MSFNNELIQMTWQTLLSGHSLVALWSRDRVKDFRSRGFSSYQRQGFFAVFTFLLILCKYWQGTRKLSLSVNFLIKSKTGSVKNRVTNTPCYLESCKKVSSSVSANFSLHIICQVLSLSKIWVTGTFMWTLSKILQENYI